MLKFVLLFLIFCCHTGTLSAQYDDPNFEKPASGYGADGSYAVEHITFPSPDFPGENIEIFYPGGVATAVPTLFFAHGFGGTFSAYVGGMLEYVARKGYAIVFVPYPTTGVSIVERCDILLAGFRRAARTYPNVIDTTQVGFMGHSFGGGAMFGIAHRCFSENNWGENGRLLFSLAPWYSYELTQAQLQSFPSNTRLIMQVYDDDMVNDHRMAIDVFNNINIPVEEKDFILVKSDTLQGYIYAADHAVPGTYQVFDALDYYAFYRLLDALCDYTFHGNQAGKEVALGNGSTAQVTMPAGLKPLVQTDAPVPIYPEDKYGFPCSAVLNPRNEYCPALSSVGEADQISYILTIEPNPVVSQVRVLIPPDATGSPMRVLNLSGKLMLSQAADTVSEVTLDMAGLPSGIYCIMVGRYYGRIVKM
ncbi:MAG TPA: T9SS type A sorting domain-containing protein [Saprospiraceae bacterium]|nr:T9SS type A sorting domain-containing protein [Saprospiraceae bacterium]HPI08403.1 T9SS type A sorting domain-containing protein [Saprospiraceae bacterium]